MGWLKRENGLIRVTTSVPEDLDKERAEKKISRAECLRIGINHALKKDLPELPSGDQPDISELVAKVQRLSMKIAEQSLEIQKLRGEIHED